DFFLVLMLPNAGDELQGIKRGIMELADALLINKADGDWLTQAQQAQQHYQNALHMLRQDAVWTPKVLTCSALKQQGIADVWQMLGEYEKAMRGAQRFEQKRREQNRAWMDKLIQQLLAQKLAADKRVGARLPDLQAEVLAGRLSPYQAALQITALFLGDTE
ncbi:MAG: hypothetical protein R3183_14310, partial [Oleiphilaceae bacterium]|nr:hypothetical protein [Oleiphilaceae bacterium]